MNLKHCKLKYWILFGLIGICLLIIAPTLVGAQTFSSDNYILEWGNFNMTSGRKSSTNYQLTDTVGQMAPGQFDSNGYTLKSGFQYIYDVLSYAFSFEINDLSIDFGSLTPGVGTTDTNVITVSSPAGNGYQIYAFESHPLQTLIGDTIPDTTCDTTTCSESVSAPWTQNDTYGFGFNAIGINNSQAVTGIGTSNFFANNSYFRQFADASLSETPQIIMQEDSPTYDHSARITYKVNASTSQPAGDYQTNIIFTAIPKY